MSKKRQREVEEILVNSTSAETKEAQTKRLKAIKVREETNIVLRAPHRWAEICTQVLLPAADRGHSGHSISIQPSDPDTNFIPYFEQIVKHDCPATVSFTFENGWGHKELRWKRSGRGDLKDDGNFYSRLVLHTEEAQCRKRAEERAKEKKEEKDAEKEFEQVLKNMASAALRGEQSITISSEKRFNYFKRWLTESNSDIAVSCSYDEEEGVTTMYWRNKVFYEYWFPSFFG